MNVIIGFFGVANVVCAVGFWGKVSMFTTGLNIGVAIFCFASMMILSMR